MREVADGAKHLIPMEKENLYKLLVKCEEIFDGSLVVWKTDDVDFEMKYGAQPFSQRYYPVPYLYKVTFKKI